MVDNGWMDCDDLPVTLCVHRVLSLTYPSYRVHECSHHCTTHTVYNITNIIVNELHIVRFRWQLVIEIYTSQTIAYKWYFHVQICAFPHLNVLSLYVCVLCRILPHIHEYTYDTGQSRPYYFSGCISNFKYTEAPTFVDWKNFKLLELRASALF